MANKLRWLGHSAWQLTTSKGKVFLVDPWLSGNAVANLNIADLGRADYVLLTHDHGDHASDAPAVVRQTGATLTAQPETTARYVGAGEPQEKALANGSGMNIGGTADLDGVKVMVVEAYHSSETGTPAGYILTLEDGKVIYFAGDTGLHANMATWGQLFDIDVAVVPIGGHFTMDGFLAAHAVRMLGAKVAVPTHYKTFPLLAQSADEFIQHLNEQSPTTRVQVLEVGETFEF